MVALQVLHVHLQVVGYVRVEDLAEFAALVGPPHLLTLSLHFTCDGAIGHVDPPMRSRLTAAWRELRSLSVVVQANWSDIDADSLMASLPHGASNVALRILRNRVTERTLVRAGVPWSPRHECLSLDVDWPGLSRGSGERSPATAEGLLGVVAGGPYPNLRRLQLRIWRPLDRDYLPLLEAFARVLEAAPGVHILSVDLTDCNDVHMCELLTVLRKRPFRSLIVHFRSCTVAGLAMFVCGVRDVEHLSVSVREPLSSMLMMPLFTGGGWPRMPQALDIHLTRSNPLQQSFWVHPSLNWTLHVH